MKEIEVKLYNFRIYDASTNETLMYLKAEDVMEASHFVFKVYGDTDKVDVERV
jgi:hypothetical protein